MLKRLIESVDDGRWRQFLTPGCYFDRTIIATRPETEFVKNGTGLRMSSLHLSDTHR